MVKKIVFGPYNLFVFQKCLTTRAFKKFQYGYHGKNGKVSDQTERTYWEYCLLQLNSSIIIRFVWTEKFSFFDLKFD